MGTGKHDDGVYTGKKVGHHVFCLSLPEPGAAGSSYPPVSVPHSTGISEAHVALPFVGVPRIQTQVLMLM